MAETHIHFHLDAKPNPPKPPPPPKPPLYLGVNNRAYSPLNTICYSTDNIFWKNIVTGGFRYNYEGRNFYGNGIVKGPTRYVAVGLGDSALNSIMWSPNGSNWSNINSGGFANERYETEYDDNDNEIIVSISSFVGIDICYGNNLFIAGGLNGLYGLNNIDMTGTKIQYSGDASNWSNSVNNLDMLLNKVVVGPSLWVCVGQSHTQLGSIAYSKDGSNWSNIKSGGFLETEYNINNNYGRSSICNSVVYGNNLWVAVGSGNSTINTIQYSKDGSNWSNINSGGFNRFYSIGDIAYGSNLWVAVGVADSLISSIQYSKDGSNWSNGGFGLVEKPTTISFTTVTSVVTIGKKKKEITKSLWVASGNFYGRNFMQYSSNGSNWYNKQIYVSQIIQ